MNRKTCFKCKTSKPLESFYKHPMMGDGRLGKCKECTKQDVRNNYAKRRAYYRRYDAVRARDPNRKAATLEYQRNKRTRNPEKNRARALVAYHVRRGNLIKMPCEVCGSRRKIQAHHDDYDKPLNVRWLCFKHHCEAHGKVAV